MIKITETNHQLKRNHCNDRSPIQSESIVEVNHKLLKSIKYLLKKQERTDLRHKETNLIYDEWKEIARRVDFLMFIIFLIVVIATPICLFGKFSVMNNRSVNTKGCQCIEK